MEEEESRSQAEVQVRTRNKEGKLTHFLTGHHSDSIEMLSSLLSSVEVGPFRTTKQFISEICTKMDEQETRMYYTKSKRKGEEHRT